MAGLPQKSQQQAGKRLSPAHGAGAAGRDPPNDFQPQRQQHGWHATAADTQQFVTLAEYEQMLRPARSDAASSAKGAEKGKRGQALEDSSASASKPSVPSFTVPADSVAAHELDQMQQHTCAAAGLPAAGGDLLIYRGSLGGSACTVLIDSGASLPFASEDWALKRGFTPIPAEPVRVALPNGVEIVCSRTIQASLKLGEHRERIVLRLIPLSAGYDVVLGASWLAHHNPDIDFRTGTVTLRQRGSTVVIRRAQVQQRAGLHLMTAAQMARSCRKGGTLFAAVVRPCEGGEVAAASGVHPLAAPLLEKYKVVFSEPHGLPPKRSVDHAIPLADEGARPFSRPMYRMSPAELDELKKHLTDLIEKGFIRPSKSPWGAPVLFAPKPGGGLRLCIDYRGLNALSVKNRYPLPRIDELLDRLTGAKVMSKLDLRAGYHQIRLKEEDIPKTAFRTRYGHFEFTVLAFGLTNAPATFQALMNDVFSDLLDRFVIVYLDDILVYSSSEEEHQRHLDEVLSRLEKAQLYARAEKCAFFQERVKFLGHVVSSKGVELDDKKLDVVKAWQTPTNVTELRSFIGLANFFRRFVRRFAHICAPLHALTSSKAVWSWGPEHQAAFEELKLALTSAPVVVPFDPNRPCLVYTDASDLQMGAVLT